MRKTILLILAAGALLAAPAARSETTEQLARQVRAVETAFAKTMADRNQRGFAAHIADEAVFFGDDGIQRGKTDVVASWKSLFEGTRAAFSWEPEEVQVLDSGKLAFSSGPVRDPQGRQIGTFNSIWRRESDGSWKIVFDKGCPRCNCSPTP